MKKHPIQPIEKDAQGVLRFKQNAIVRHLLDEETRLGRGLNALAVIDFPQEDREQFAQLIGYSLSGFSELNYATDVTYGAAEKMAKEGVTSDQARIEALEEMLDQARSAIREAAVAVFRCHPDDLHT